MKSSVVTKQLTAASANAIAVSQTLGGAGTLTLTANPVVLDTQRRVIVTSAGNDSGLTWTIIGTDDSAAPIKDVFAGANIGAAQSNLNFATVVSVAGSAGAAGAVTVGTNTVGSTPWKLFDSSIATPNMSAFMELLSGAATATFEYTYANIRGPIGVQSSVANGPATVNPTPLPHPDLQSLSASKDGNVNWDIFGYRLTINSGTGQWRCTTHQAGLASP